MDEQEKKARVDIAKFQEVIKSLENQNRRLKALKVSVMRKAGNYVMVPLSRFLTDDRGPFEQVKDATATGNRPRGRPKKKQKKQ